MRLAAIKILSEKANKIISSGLIRILTILLFSVLYSPSLFSQQQVVLTDPEVEKMTYYGETGPLRDMPLITNSGKITRTLKTGYTPKDWILNESVNPNALPKGEDPALQKTYPASNRLADLNLIRDFDGIGYTFVNPADPISDVGPNHVVQMVNQSSGSTVNIYDKTGNLLLGPLEFDVALGFPDIGRGDPIVVYDALADRWLLSEFEGSATGGNQLFVAISQTPDPTGAYWLYSFTTPTFPDYPKYAVWPDAYFITANEGGGVSSAIALDRNQMLIGAPATAQRVTIPDYPTIGFQAATPVTHDTGTPPPAGAPGMIMRMADDAWSGSIPNDRLEMWEFDVDFAVPANTTFSGPTFLATAPFDTELCGYLAFSCFGQPGGGIGLDPLREVLMNRIQYRNFGTHEAIVCNHVTDVTGSDDGGIRWYELRRSGGIANPWSIFQQGTFAPDNISRWMAAIAINSAGDIGLLYNVVDNTSVFPGLRFTGRTAGDPLGMMTIPETAIIDGTASNSSNRYGDYNSLDTDPANELTFWGTGMYNNAATWSTRIAEFEITAPFSVTCPTNTDLGTYDCTDIATLPAHPTNQAEAAAPPYNIVSVASPTGTIFVESSDDMAINACGDVAQTITRTVFIWDDLPGGTPGVFDPGVEESGSCTYTYVFNPDIQPPTLMCPPDMPGLNCNDPVPIAATTFAEFTALGGTISDDCTMDPMDFTVTHMDDDMGTNCPGDPRVIMRTYTVTDDCGNPSMCTQTITYVPAGPPTLNCPMTETIVLASGECDFEYIYDVTGMADCNPNPTIMQLQGPPSGSFLPHGSTTVFEYSIDDGCTVVTCMWEITVEEAVDGLGPQSINDRINTSLGSDCSLVLDAGMFFEGPYGCSEDFIFFINGLESNTITECGTYDIMVMDPEGNSSWTTLIVEDKLPPKSVNPCPPDDPCDVTCVDFELFGLPAMYEDMYRASLMDCSGFEGPADPTFVRQPSEICGEPDVLWAIFSPVDGKGNIGLDTLHFSISKITVDDVDFPPNYPGTCDESRHPSNTGTISVNGNDIPFGDVPYAQICDILIGYTDLVIPTCGTDCDGSLKIIRSWTALDWCLQRLRTEDQILNLKDTEDPTIDPFDPDVASVDPWTCQVERYLLPEMDADDNCAADDKLKKTIVPPPGITIAQEADGNYYAYNVPKGTHYFEYYAEDCCGNVSLVQPFQLTIIDEVAPIAISKQFSVVALSNDGRESGTAKIYAESIDNGSYDRCTDVLLQIRRDGYYVTEGSVDDDLDYLNPHDEDDTWDGVDYFNTDDQTGALCFAPYATYPCDVVGNDTYADDGQHTWNLPRGCNQEVDPDEGQYVKFCCDDLMSATVDVNNDGEDDPGYVKVWLRVWDNANMTMDAQGNPIYGDVTVDGRTDYFNETWAYVKVEVSEPPILEVTDATINCDWPFEEKMEEGYFGEDCIVDDRLYEYEITEWMEQYLYWEGICGIQICIDRWYYGSNYDPVCRDGDIYIVYRAKNPDSKGLEVTRTQKITVTNLDELQCNDVAWPPSYTESDCTITNEEPYLEWEANACSLIGWTYRSDTFRFESDACVKIINEYTVIDWCKFDDYHNENNNGSGGPTGSNLTVPEPTTGFFEGGHDYFDGLLCQDPNFPYFFNDGRTSDNGVYKYVEVIKIDDDVPPQMEVQDTMYAITNIECERTIQLEATVTDGSDDDCPATWFKWEITFDWNENGDFTDDYTYTRDRFGDPLRGNEENPASLEFVPYDWTKVFPYAPIVFKGPMLSYDVQYIVYDGCGNVDKEVRTVMIVDKKPPTPYCVSLSSAVMDNGQVELWARDFDKGSFDNCYDDEDLLFTFNEEHPVLDDINKVHYFKGAGEEATIDEYNEGDAQKWDPSQNSSARIFDCDDVDNTLENPVQVRMTVWDPKILDGELINWDWCSVELTLIDNQGACGQQRASISGEVATEQGDEVSEVSITLDNLSNPEFSLEVMTGNNGMYAFANNPMYVGYDISALKDGDDTEGVSTLDLVLIQRHILGIEAFDSPYKMIAADINSDRKITGTDLVVLRKTILDLYHEFPTNSSWRFVEKNQGLTLDNALSVFNEVIGISSLDGNLTEEDFVAVKIGDVNATARTNGRSLNQTRSAGMLTLELEEQQVTEGQSVEVTFSSKDFNQVYGYQFTLELDGLIIESVQAGNADMTTANIGVLDEHTVTVSYADMDGLGASDQLFTLTVIATQSGQLSEMIDLTSNVLNSEGYVGEGLDIHTIELTINGSEARSFRLDQNEPNPFDQVTIVGFELPASGNATLTVYDVAGKIVTSIRGTYAQGYNEIKLNKEDLNTTGVLYYTLNSGEFTATKKMIIIE